MELLQVLGFFSLLIFTAAQTTTHSPAAPPSYLLLAPKALCSGVPASLSVTILIDSEVEVLAHIVHGDQTVSSASATVAGGSTERMILPAVEVSESSDIMQPYILQVQGQVGGAKVFFNSTELHLKCKGRSILIQTDKPRYKPGQLVRIRIIVLTFDGKPDRSPVDITIRDPRGNLLRQWLSLDNPLGVVPKVFKLSKYPPLGQWSICATAAGISSDKSFNVTYYVLPRFEVSLNVSDVVYREDSLRVKIIAMYMHNKPVHGYVSILYIFNHQAHHDFMEINGTGEFRFDFPSSYFHEMSQRSLSMYDYSYEKMDKEVTIMVNVTENLTGVTYESKKKVKVASSRYTINFKEYRKTIHPSLNFTAMVKICPYNNHTLSAMDHNKILSVVVRQWRSYDAVMPHQFNMTRSLEMMNPEVEMEQTFHVPADGVIPLNIQLIEDIKELVIEAHFEDSYKRLYLSREYTSPRGFYLLIRRPYGGKMIEVGSPLTLEIESNFPMTEFHYVVRTRSQVVSAGKRFGVLTLVPESEWAPCACVIVYCVHPSGEIVNDYMRLPITKTLPNKVSLSWSDTLRKPAEEVTLKVDVMDPSSVVWILVVDKAAKGKASMNDITEEMVLKDKKEYDDTDSDSMKMIDPYSVFKACGLVALTDANLHMPPPPLLPMMGAMPLFNMEESSYMEPKPEPRERWFFPETWIWMNMTTGDSTSAHIPLTVPDSITTWIASAFVISDHGIGIVEKPVELTVFQYLLLSLNMPACIIRGEELLLEVVLFNYLPQDLVVSVTVAESDAFRFTGNKPPLQDVFVASQRGATVHFSIKPLVLGEIHFSVKAVSSAGSDHVRRTIVVKPEGLEKTRTFSLLFEVSPSQPFIEQEVMFPFPPEVVTGSERASVTAVGDILGPSISGLDSLIQMPYGCGEQNMINFAPNIYVLQYLTAVGQADQATMDRATGYMMSGYERELSFKRDDGSFSAFGEQDSSGSTWLSAFVLRCFLQARPFIAIDPDVLHGVEAWLGWQQGSDGSYVEVGRVIHTELQGGQDGPVSLTAFVLIALLEDRDILTQNSSQVSAAVKFLEWRVIQGVSSNYSLSLVCYALALSSSGAAADSAISELMARANMEGGVPTWTSPGAGLSDSWQPSSTDIEMASYLLLALQRRDRTEEGVGLMKWLSQQRNHRGGFGSTQDTIVALQALAAYATLMKSHDFDLNIRVTNAATAANVAHFYIDQYNQLVHRSQQIHPDREIKLKVTAEGQGFALVQLNVFYNIRTEVQLPMKRRRKRRRRFVHQSDAFFLQVSLHDINVNLVDLYVCYSLWDYLGLNQTGMAIMEVGLLSGFQLVEDSIKTDKVIKKVETEPGKVILYLDSVTPEHMCVGIHTVLEYKVGHLQQANVVFYDYYEPRRRVEVPYIAEGRNTMSTCSMFQDDWTKCVPDDYYYGSTSKPYYPPHYYTTQGPYYPLNYYPTPGPHYPPYPPNDNYPSDPFKPPNNYPSDPFNPPNYNYPSDPFNPPNNYPLDPFNPPNNNYPSDPFNPPNNNHPSDPFNPPNNNYPSDPFNPPNNNSPLYPFKPPNGNYPSYPFKPPNGNYPSDPFNPPNNYYPPEDQYGSSYFSGSSQNVLTGGLSLACLLLFTVIFFGL